jgi:CheY-like chemotaxis protein
VIRRRRGDGARDLAPLLERMGLSVITAVNGAEAVERFTADLDGIDLVILDMGMPAMGGAECFERLRALRPVPVLVTTGYAIEAETHALVEGARILEKPFGRDELRRMVGELLAKDRSVAPEIDKAAVAG